VFTTIISIHTPTSPMPSINTLTSIVWQRRYRNFKLCSTSLSCPHSFRHFNVSYFFALFPTYMFIPLQKRNMVPVHRSHTPPALLQTLRHMSVQWRLLLYIYWKYITHSKGTVVGFTMSEIWIRIPVLFNHFNLSKWLKIVTIFTQIIYIYFIKPTEQNHF
jgi:hypothetical protein